MGRREPAVAGAGQQRRPGRAVLVRRRRRAGQKVSGSTTTYTFFGHYEEEVTDGTTTAISHYSFGGLRIAVKRGSTLYHLHGDHLGSTSLTTAGSTVEASRTYYAYGSERAATGDLQTDRTFTGQKRDATGLMYYNARYYDPALGTFVSPDSLVPGAGRVVDYNRFAYVRNNPLRYTDPTGHCIFGLDTIVCIILAAAAIGGVANAAGNVVVQVGQNWDSDRSWQDNVTDFNKKEAAISFGFGAVGGGLAPVLGPTGALVANTALGAAQEMAVDMAVEGKSFVESIDHETAEAAFWGAISTGYQRGMPRAKASTGTYVSRTLSRESEVYVRPRGVSEDWAQQGRMRLYREQAKHIAKPRFIIGAAVGNIPLPDQETLDWIQEQVEEMERKLPDRIWRGGGAPGELSREPIHMML